jgi:hypothetical protein
LGKCPEVFLLLSGKSHRKIQPIAEITTVGYHKLAYVMLTTGTSYKSFYDEDPPPTPDTPDALLEIG